MFSAIVIAVLALIVSAGLAYVAGKWYFKVDEAMEDLKRSVGKLALELSKVGFILLPDFLNDFVVGDYSEMLVKVKAIVRLATSDPIAFMREFDAVYNRLTDAKLATAEGRLVLEAKLKEAQAASA